MIKREFFTKRKDGVKLYRTYSTTGKCIRKIGTDEIYQEAIDIEKTSNKYEEIDNK